MDTIILPIVDVTVLEDRAQVQRRGRVMLAAGANHLVVSGLAPLLADKTLVGSSPTPGVRIADVRVRRARVAKEAQPEAVTAVMAELQRIERETTALDHAEASLDSVDGQLAELRQQLLREAVVDTAWTRAAPAFWSERLREIEQREDHGVSERTRIAARRAGLVQAQADAWQRRQLLSTIDSVVACTAELLVEVPTGGEVELSLAYIVANAAWRPCYVARLLDGRVQMDAEACIWQRSGEEWRGVRLRLSTERLDLGSDPPALAPDLLRLKPKAAQVVVEERDRAREDTGGAAGRPAAELPGVDDGGEARLLLAPGAHDVAGDGLPHRVPLFAFTAPAKVRLVVRAELVEAAILASVQANAAPQPLLAGPVELIRDGGAAGRSTVRFTAPGAEFELGWGPEPELRVARDAWQKDEAAGMLGSWKTSDRRVRLGLANLGAGAHAVEVEERIPVSELAQVQVEFDAAQTTPAAKPDADGIVRWSLSVPARAHAKVELAWKLRTKESVQQA